jgi:hypothetical protein
MGFPGDSAADLHCDSRAFSEGDLRSDPGYDCRTDSPADSHRDSRADSRCDLPGDLPEDLRGDLRAKASGPVVKREGSVVQGLAAAALV